MGVRGGVALASPSGEGETLTIDGMARPGRTPPDRIIPAGLAAPA